MIQAGSMLYLGVPAALGAVLWQTVTQSVNPAQLLTLAGVAAVGLGVRSTLKRLDNLETGNRLRDEKWDKQLRGEVNRMSMSMDKLRDAQNKEARLLADDISDLREAFGRLQTLVEVRDGPARADKRKGSGT